MRKMPQSIFRIFLLLAFPGNPYRMKFVPMRGSFSGRPYFSLPSSMERIKKVMFRASVRIICKPSPSCCASSARLPWMPFQYYPAATGIPLMVKYLLSSSKVAVKPPRLADATAAPTFMVLSKGVL